MFNIYEQTAPYSIDENGLLLLGKSADLLEATAPKNNTDVDVDVDVDVDSSVKPLKPQENPSHLRRNSLLQSPKSFKSDIIDYLEYASIVAR